MKCNRIIIALLALLASLPAFLEGNELFLLQTVNPFGIGEGALALQAEGGEETGSIPDGFLSAGISMDLFRRVSLGAALTGTAFPGRGAPRFASVDASIRLGAWKSGGAELQAYLSGLAFLGHPLFTEYAGNLPEVSYVLSPRAEGGYDAVMGLVGSYIPGPRGPVLSGGFDLAYTGGRESFPEFMEPLACLRLRGSLSPSLRFGPSWALALQNRVVYWFDRGYSYELLPQAQWDILPSLSLAAGLGIPLIGAESWRFLAGARWTPRRIAARPPTKPPDSIQVIPQPAGFRIRVYFQFLGDEAALFAPGNAVYGKRNRALISELVAYLARYPGYDIVVEGHTNRARFELSFAKEQREEMLPLAAARADAVLRALTAAGVARNRISVEAIGGLEPLADFRDADNCWKNRRVEIVLKEAKKKRGQDAKAPRR